MKEAPEKAERSHDGGGKWGHTILMIIGVIVIVAVLAKQAPCTCGTGTCCAPASPPAANSKPAEPPAAVMNKNGLPRLVDFGAGKCMACQKMAPVLDELRKEYAGSLQVDFIDVWKHPDEARRYGITLIPTQIFFDRTGKERFRHEGFFAKKDILKKWRELGVSIEAKSQSKTTTREDQR